MGLVCSVCTHLKARVEGATEITHHTDLLETHAHPLQRLWPTLAVHSKGHAKHPDRLSSAGTGFDRAKPVSHDTSARYRGRRGAEKSQSRIIRLRIDNGMTAGRANQGVAPKRTIAASDIPNMSLLTYSDVRTHHECVTLLAPASARLLADADGYDGRLKAARSQSSLLPSRPSVDGDRLCNRLPWNGAKALVSRVRQSCLPSRTSTERRPVSPFGRYLGKCNVLRVGSRSPDEHVTRCAASGRSFSVPSSSLLV